MKITLRLSFDNKAEEAMKFYTSIFKNSEIVSLTRYEVWGKKLVPTEMKTKVAAEIFRLESQQIAASDGLPPLKSSNAMSFHVICETKAEMDELWEKLSEGGEKENCGWLKDKYGQLWQIVPSAAIKITQDKKSKKTKKLVETWSQMDKIDVDYKA